MIEVSFVKDYGKDHNDRRVIRLPEVLLRAVSHRSKDLCEAGDSRSFTAEQVLGCQDVEFWCEGERFGHLMTCFTKWLYTSKLSDDVFWPWELWRLAQLMGVPALMNLCVREFARCYSYPNYPPYQSINPNGRKWKEAFNWQHARRLWDEADFNFEEEHECDLTRLSVYWGNKRMLKFGLDVFLYLDLNTEGGSEDVRVLIQEKDDLAMQVVKKLGARDTKSSNLPPWTPQNIEKYLIKEDTLRKSDKCYSPTTSLKDAKDDQPVA